MAFESPQQTAVLDIITACCFGSVGDQHRHVVKFVNGWCGPSRNFVTFGSPDFGSIFDIEGGDKRLALDVALNDDFVFVDDWRGSESPLIAGIVEPTTVEKTGIKFPKQFTFF